MQKHLLQDLSDTLSVLFVPASVHSFPAQKLLVLSKIMPINRHQVAIFSYIVQFFAF